MKTLFIFFASLIFSSKAGVIRVPKIYNALISSDENLTPSQAYPVLEPVLRTTALGVAFPPLIAHPPVQRIFETNPKTELLPEKIIDQEREQSKPTPEITYHGSLYPLTYDTYFPYSYTTSDFLYPALPTFYQQPAYVDYTNFQGKKQEKEQPAQTAAPTNFKKNPEIPDVPPPPLPIKNEKKRKSS